MERIEWLSTLPGDWSIAGVSVKGTLTASIARWLWRRWRYPGRPSLLIRCWRTGRRILRPYIVIQELRTDIYDQALIIASQDATISSLQSALARRSGIAHSPLSPAGTRPVRKSWPNGTPRSRALSTAVESINSSSSSVGGNDE